MGISIARGALGIDGDRSRPGGQQFRRAGQTGLRGHRFGRAIARGSEHDRRFTLGFFSGGHESTVR
jgi:hypothetical protein